MQFVSVDPFVESVPFIEVCAGTMRYDLHNDAIMQGFEVDVTGRVAKLRWTLKSPAWRSPAQREPAERHTEDGLTIVLSGVRTVQASGEVVPSEANGPFGVDFMEFNRLQLGLGELRIVFENSSEIAVTATHCQLLVTQLE